MLRSPRRLGTQSRECFAINSRPFTWRAWTYSLAFSSRLVSCSSSLVSCRRSSVLDWQTLGRRMFEVFQSGCLTLQKLKTGGTQCVLVQHQQVNVGPGGQAVVAARVGGGSRTRGRRGKNRR
jgi:hypothetical protein